MQSFFGGWGGGAQKRCIIGDARIANALASLRLCDTGLISCRIALTIRRLHRKLDQRVSLKTVP